MIERFINVRIRTLMSVEAPVMPVKITSPEPTFSRGEENGIAIDLFPVVTRSKLIQHPKPNRGPAVPSHDNYLSDSMSSPGEIRAHFIIDKLPF